MELPISLDDGGKLPLFVLGSVQTEVKYSKLIYLVFEGKTGTSCCVDVLVHESTHPADLF